MPQKQRRGEGGAPGFGNLSEYRDVYIFQRRSMARAIPKNHAGDNQKDEGRAKTDAQIGVIGDGSDDLRGKCIAKAVDDKEIDADGHGAYRRGDGVDNGGVERAGIEEKEELSGKQGRNGP